MKKLLIALGVLLGIHMAETKAAVDPNFYIYLCFGQSNMEGNAAAEAQDKTSIGKRFQLLATCNYDNPKRTMGQWYNAVPPLVNPVGSLGPTDYFGRTMVAALPANVRIGVVPVAMGGSPIEMFDKDKYAKKLADNPNDWWATIAKNCYDGNPYGRLIEMGKKAQEVGVIKGILLHQGCSNNGDPNWPNMVKKIYNDMLSDLGLAADTVPLFVGETLRQENGGACYGHNTQVDRMPSVVPTSHVISSEDLPGNGVDPWHFNATGYRILGKRYAFAALQLMGQELKADTAYTMNTSMKKFYVAKSLELADTITCIPVGQIPASAVFTDGHKEKIGSELTFASGELMLEPDGKLPASQETSGTAEAVYEDFSRQQITKTVYVNQRFFPLAADYVTKLLGTATFNEDDHSFTMNGSSMAGWKYENGIDLSAYRYMVVKFRQPQDCNLQIRIFKSTSTSAPCFKDTVNDKTTVSIDLNNLVYSSTGAKIDPSSIKMVAFRAGAKGTFYVDDVFLTNHECYAPASIGAIAQEQPSTAVYNLQGVKLCTQSQWHRLPAGVYVVNGKLRLK